MFGKSRRALLPLTTVLALGLVAGLMALAPRPTAPASTPAQAPAATPAPQAPPPAPAPLPPARTHDGTRAWVPGLLYRYQLDSSQEVSFAQSQPGAEVPPGMRFLIQGEWHVGIVSAEAERVLARVTLVPTTVSVTFDGQGALAPEAHQGLQRGLSTPFFLTLHRSGAVQQLHFEPVADVLAQGLLRSLAAATQHVLPGPPQDTWHSEELDPTGRYTARYRRLSPSRFEKSKQSYSQMATPEGLRPVGRDLSLSVSTLTTFELEQDLWLSSLEGRERLEVDSGPSMPRAINSLQVSLRLLGRAQDPSLPGAFSSRQPHLRSLSMASYQDQAQDPNDGWRQVLGGKTFEDLLQDLRSLPTGEKQRDDARTRALEQLRALFLLQPDKALEVPAQLPGMDPLAASPLLGALSAASTPEASRALSLIVDDSALSLPVRTDAVAALGMAHAPSEEGVSALRRMAGAPQPELADTATLGLGNAAMNLHDDDERAAAALTHSLDSAYRTARDSERQALLLRALGNTRDPNVLPTLQSVLASQAPPEVRQAAVEALRHMPAPAADRLLSSVLLSDPSPEVRQAAVFASSFRPLEPLLPAFSQALRTDSSDAVRAELVTLLGSQSALLPQARELLAWTSQNDSNPTLRGNATTFLSSLP